MKKSIVLSLVILLFSGTVLAHDYIEPQLSAFICTDGSQVFLETENIGPTSADIGLWVDNNPTIEFILAPGGSRVIVLPANILQAALAYVNQNETWYTYFDVYYGEIPNCGENYLAEENWQPTLIETQSRIVINPEWFGLAEYQVKWVNQFGVETLIFRGTVGESGDMSFIIDPNSFEAPFLLNTYVNDTMVQQNWVDADGIVFYTGAGDWDNLDERPLGNFPWRSFPVLDSD